MRNVIPLKRLDAWRLARSKTSNAYAGTRGRLQCGMRNAECGMCSVRGARCKVQTKCGMTNAECGIPDFGFEPPQRAEISARYVRTCVLSNRLGFEFRAGLRPLTYMARRATKEGEFFPASIAGGTHDHDCLGRCWARQCITATAAPPTRAADESADFSKSGREVLPSDALLQLLDTGLERRHVVLQFLQAPLQDLALHPLNSLGTFVLSCFRTPFVLHLCSVTIWSRETPNRSSS